MDEKKDLTNNLETTKFLKQEEYPRPQPTKTEKHEILFKEDLKDYKFDSDVQNFLTDFIEYAIQSIATLCTFWLLKDEIDPQLMKGMLGRSCYFYTRGILFQFLIGFEYNPAVAQGIGDIVVDYIIAQGLDLFGVRSGIIKVN